MAPLTLPVRCTSRVQRRNVDLHNKSTIRVASQTKHAKLSADFSEHVATRPHGLIGPENRSAMLQGVITLFVLAFSPVRWLCELILAVAFGGVANACV